jgi:hypothetical protein
MTPAYLLGDLPVLARVDHARVLGHDLLGRQHAGRGGGGGGGGGGASGGGGGVVTRLGFALQRRCIYISYIYIRCIYKLQYTLQLTLLLLLLLLPSSCPHSSAPCALWKWTDSEGTYLAVWLCCAVLDRGCCVRLYVCGCVSVVSIVWICTLGWIKTINAAVI